MVFGLVGLVILVAGCGQPSGAVGGGALSSMSPRSPLVVKALPIAHTRPVSLPPPAKVASTGPAPGQRDLVFATAELGFLVADNASGAMVERTTNGGDSWSVVWQHADAGLDWVGMAGPEVVATGVSGPRAATDAAQATPLLLRSADHGSTWLSIRPALPAETIAASQTSFTASWAGLRLHFANSSVGFALLDPAFGQQAGTANTDQMLRTTDGGRHWATVVLPDGLPTGGMAFVDATHDFATGATTSEKPGCASELWSSSDAGARWQAVRGTCASYLLDALSFPDPSVGYAAGGNLTKYGMYPQRAVMATTDGGVNWSSRYESGGSSTGGGPSTDWGGPLAALDFPTATLGYALVGGCSMGENGPCGGMFWVSRDGGRTWVDTGESGTRLAVAGPGQPWLLGSGGPGGGGVVARRSTDGGRTWKAVARPSALDISALASANFVFAGTLAGDFESDNAGASWTTAADPGLEAREHEGYTPAAVLASGLVVVDLGGQVWVSRNGGRSGRVVDVPGMSPDNTTGGVAFSSPQQGVAIGAAPCDTKAGPSAPPAIVSVTSDGGRSWKEVGSVDLGVSAVASAGSVAVAIGSGCAVGARVATTNDGGRQWQLWSLPAGLSCDTASGTGQTLVLGCQAGQSLQDSEILVSLNGGRSWDDYRLVAPDASGTAITAVAAASGDLWADGPPGALWHSTDGGRRWTAVAPAFPVAG